MTSISTRNIRPGSVFKALCILSGLVALAFCSAAGEAQISFRSAIDLALHNSPRVKMAQDDLDKSVASLAETRDVFIPSLMGTGGVGASSGITLNVPTIFTVSAQSLVFSYSQRNYIRAARLGVQAAGLALKDVRQIVEEDTAITYLSLDIARQQQAAMDDQYGYAQKLVTIVQERVAAGRDSDMELKKARRTAVQIRLQQLQVADQAAALAEHLSRLIGLPADHLTTVSDSIPAAPSLPTAQASTSSYADTPSVLAAQANARARLQQAFGDSRYTLRPQVAFEAQYGRISPLNSVSTYYNLQGNYNTMALGIQIQLPFIDRSRNAKARGSLADAFHAEHEAAFARDQQNESRLKLLYSVAELTAREELAELDQGIAQDQLDAIVVQLQLGMGNSAGSPMTPKDEQNTHIQERQKYLDMLNAKLQLREIEINVLRQTGELENWLASVPRAVVPTPTTP